MSAEARAAFVVRGVVRQALADAGVSALVLVEPPTAASKLIERWCGLPFTDADRALTVSAACKTQLLLATDPLSADLYPLGDLYARDLATFGVSIDGDEVKELAESAGGIEKLDGALHKLLDERRVADAAFADLPHIRDAVMMRLQKARFHRAHMGIVPKLGARTIGIDLHI
jgi:hypothetical protein